MDTPFDVIVGQTYSVPCAINSMGEYVPVVGPAHVDGAELCQHPETKAHYHVDYRFTLYEHKQRGWLLKGPIKYQKLTCVRERSDNGNVLAAMIRLAKAYRTTRLDLKGRVCPHNKQIVVNADGQCPGHGFCWNMETGLPKYRWPYFLRFKGETAKYLAKDHGVMDLPVTKDILGGVLLELLDSDDQFIGEFMLENWGGVNSGDIFKFTTNCTQTKKATVAH